MNAPKIECLFFLIRCQSHSVLFCKQPQKMLHVQREALYLCAPSFHFFYKVLGVFCCFFVVFHCLYCQLVIARPFPFLFYFQMLHQMQNLHHLTCIHFLLLLSHHYVVCLLKDLSVPHDLMTLPVPLCHSLHIVRHMQNVDFIRALVCHCIQNRLHLLDVNVALQSSSMCSGCPTKFPFIPQNFHCTSCIVHVCTLCICALISHCSQNRLHLFGTYVALLLSKHVDCPAKHISVPPNTHVDSVCFLLNHVSLFVRKLDFILAREVHGECTLVWMHAAAPCAEATQHMHCQIRHPLQIHGLICMSVNVVKTLSLCAVTSFVHSFPQT
eukprot:jgi/Antlo1/2351/1353